ncbi:DNA polymerase phi-domain-containing protein [Coemansia spiralis]|nr:DNA polymerase phi-domain-containing protein [Coemansia spiralis]
MSSTLDFYWGLASLDEEKRIDAAANLITALCKFQAEMPETDDMALTEEDLNRICASDLAYAVKRLIKGLASPRDGARQGYSMALAELLNRVPNISVKLVLDLLWKSTEATNNMKGQEQRDMRFGRIFGLMALVQSDIITRTSTTPIEIRKIVMELTAVGAKKSYLREIAYVTLASMVPMLRKFSFTEELITMFVDVALDKGAIETPDELYLAMRLRREYPWYDWIAALPHWHGKHMLSQKNLKNFAPILCELSADKKELFSSWHPQLHMIWNEIFDLYFNKEREFELESLEPVTFDILWDAVVEKGLFAPGSTQFRRYWGFLLLERLLPYLSEETVPALMSPNLVLALSDNISLAKKSVLAKVSMRAAEMLIAVCESNTKVGLAVLTHLLNQKSAFKQTDSKNLNLRTMMANRIVAKLDSEAIVGYVNYLQKVFLTPKRVRTKSGVADRSLDTKASEKSIEKQRIWAVDQMIRVARFAQLPITDELTANVLHFFVAQAAFEPATKEPEKCGIPELATAAVPPLSINIRNHLSSSLVSFVGDLNKSSSQSQEGGNVETESSGQPQAGRMSIGCSRKGAAWSTLAVDKLLDCAANKKVTFALHELSKCKPELTSMAGVLHSMDKKAFEYAAAGSTVSARRVKCLELFLGNICLIAVFWTSKDIRAEFLEAASDVAKCYEQLIAQIDGLSKTPSKRKTRSSAKPEESAQESEPKPVEVLVDMILSFLTKDLNFLRRLCEQVFVPFADLMTTDAMDAIIGVLQAKEGADIEEDNVETEMDIDDMMEVDEALGNEDGANDSDVSMTEGDQDQLEAVDEELRRKIQEALGDASVIEDAGEASASGEEEEFDDEQMTVFDDKLAEIFRHKREQKIAARDLRISLINFKLRALDLVDVFLSKQPENPLVIRLMPAVVDLAKSTHADTRNKPIHDRTMGILRSRRTKYPVGFNSEDGLALLEAIHQRARRAQDRAELAMLGNVSAFVTRALFGNAKTDAERKVISEKAFELAKGAVVDLMTRKASPIHAEFFRPTVEKLLPSQLGIFWRLALVALTDYARPNQAVNVYRQVQTYTLVEIIAWTVSRLINESSDVKDVGPFADIVENVLHELQSALCDTILYAMSDRNKIPSSGKLQIEPLRLKEILASTIEIIQRCTKEAAFKEAAERAFETDEKWTKAIAGLSSPSNLFSLEIFRSFCKRMAKAEQLADPLALASVASSQGKKGKKASMRK